MRDIVSLTINKEEKDMFREIKVKEIKEIKKEEEKDQGYRKIKPEHEMSDNEVDAFWRMIFAEAAAEVKAF
jgi:hypothetical protein